MTYVQERERYGRTEKFVDVQAMAKDVAKLIGGEFQAPEEGNCGDRGRIAVGGYFIAFGAGYGAKWNKVTISAWAPHELMNKARRRGSPANLPDIGVSAERDASAIAKAVQSRLMPVAAERLEVIRTLAGEADASRADLEAQAAALVKRFPAIRVNLTDDVGRAGFSLYLSGKGSASGTLYADGQISFDRVSVDSAAKALAILSTVAEG